MYVALYSLVILGDQRLSLCNLCIFANTNKLCCCCRLRSRGRNKNVVKYVRHGYIHNRRNLKRTIRRFELDLQMNMAFLRQKERYLSVNNCFEFVLNVIRIN